MRSLKGNVSQFLRETATCLSSSKTPCFGPFALTKWSDNSWLFLSSFWEMRFWNWPHGMHTAMMGTPGASDVDYDLCFGPIALTKWSNNSWLFLSSFEKWDFLNRSHGMHTALMGTPGASDVDCDLVKAWPWSLSPWDLHICRYLQICRSSRERVVRSSRSIRVPVLNELIYGLPWDILFFRLICVKMNHVYYEPCFVLVTSWWERFGAFSAAPMYS